MLKEFKEFSMRGNVMDMAVGIVIGVAFGAIIKSFVDDILMPPIGLLLGNVDFTNLFLTLKAGKILGPYSTIQAARAAGAVTLNYGVFLNTVINFLIVAFAIFLLITRINVFSRQKQDEAAPKTKECPYCLSVVPAAASRCLHCTSELRA
jgi:large conductance mechanosensitive channel